MLDLDAVSGEINLPVVAVVGLDHSRGGRRGAKFNQPSGRECVLTGVLLDVIHIYTQVIHIGNRLNIVAHLHQRLVESAADHGELEAFDLVVLSVQPVKGGQCPLEFGNKAVECPGLLIRQVVDLDLDGPLRIQLISKGPAHAGP